MERIHCRLLDLNVSLQRSMPTKFQWFRIQVGIGQRREIVTETSMPDISSPTIQNTGFFAFPDRHCPALFQESCSLQGLSVLDIV